MVICCWNLSLTVTSFFLIYLFNLFFLLKVSLDSLSRFVLNAFFVCLFFPFLFVVLLKTNWKLVSLFVHMRVCRCSISLSHLQCFLPQIFGLSELCVWWREQCKDVSTAFPCISLEREGEQGRKGSAHWQTLIPNYFYGWRVWGLLLKKTANFFLFKKRYINSFRSQ